MVDRYNPKFYINRIREILQEALRNGIRVEFEDNRLEIENTISGDIDTISEDNMLQKEEDKTMVYYIADKYECVDCPQQFSNSCICEKEIKSKPLQEYMIPRIGKFYFMTKEECEKIMNSEE